MGAVAAVNVVGGGDHSIGIGDIIAANIAAKNGGVGFPVALDALRFGGYKATIKLNVGGEVICSLW